MAQRTVLYWRDIPAQVIVKQGRKSAKRPLDVRFEKAIDRAAMLGGLAGTDDYLSHWRKGEPAECGDALEEEAAAAAEEIEAAYPQERLLALVKNAGRASD